MTRRGHAPTTGHRKRSAVATALAAVALAVSFIAPCRAAGQAVNNRYNVLFICVDDLRPELGCYGLPYIQSPNLDRFAQSGVRFDNHFVQVPTCGASRYSLLTGRSPRYTRALRNDAFYGSRHTMDSEQQAGAQSMPELFRRSGYTTVGIGKVSHTPDGKVLAYNGKGDGRDEVPHAWDRMYAPSGRWGRGWGAFFAYEGGHHREDGKGHRDLMQFRAARDEDLPDGLIAAAAVEELGALKQQGKPFFLAVGFFKPHLPFVATEPDWQAVEQAEMPSPPQPGKPDSQYWHKSREFYQYAFPFEKANPLAEADVIKTRRAYAACVRYVDRQIGKVLDALEKQGLTESTIVVVWGDHGWFLGDSQMWGKHSPHDRALRSPLLMRVPGVTRAGTACEALVETLDLYPTLIDLCAPSFTRTHHPLDGVSLAPLLDGSRPQVRTHASSYWGQLVSVRTPEHRLVFEAGDDGPKNAELFDLRRSRDPLNNIAGKRPEVVRAVYERWREAERR